MSLRTQKWALGLAALLLLGWLFRESTQIDIELHVRTVQHFEQLREQDAQLSRFVLQSRYGLLHNYDPLVNTQREVGLILEELSHDKPDLFSAGTKPIQKAFAEYQAGLQQKSNLVENFKSHNAVLGNSLRYFPLVARQQRVRFHSTARLESLLHDLLESVLLFNQQPEDGFKQQVRQSMEALQQSEIRTDPAITSLLQHVNIILGHMVEVNDLARQISQSQSSVQADKLMALYNADFAQRDRLAGHYKLAMALLAAGMLAYVGWLLNHLQRARNTLSESVRELEFQKHALDVHSIVSTTDRAGKILYTNDKFSEVSLYSREELLGQNHRMLNSDYHPPEFFKTMWATIGKGQIWQAEVRNRRKDGSFYWVDSTIAPFMDEHGKPLRYVSIRTDITARKHSEVAMQQAITDAQNARLAAEQASKTKGDFLANMSHEIRTPINGIIGFTNLTLETELSADQREFVGLVKSSADSLLHVINDILDFSKIESGKLDMEVIEFSLEAMLRDTMKSMAMRAHQKHLELLLHVAPDVPDRVFGDPGRLRQVLINLVGNAIKFTHVGEIEVGVCCKDTGPGQARLRFVVRDSGIGIAADKFATIFESFSQADTSTTRKYGGTGLGLTISSQIVDLMGGRIEVQSEVDRGSTFAFTLDMRVASMDALAHYQETGQIKGMPVLVVDDNATNRKLLHEMLCNWQMQPTVVATGDEALLALQRGQAESRPFTLAVIDVQMPGMDGFELAQRIRQDPQHGTATLMMLTSQGQRGDAARCKDIGVTGYLTKPVAQSDLLDAIMTALGKPHAGSQSSLVTQHSLREGKRKLSLLLAEDNAVNQLLAVRLLGKLGHSVAIANNGREAIEKWQRGRFDAILMDVDMPEMGGYEATRLIREQEHALGSHIPVIAMTAHAMKGAREECLHHGMDGYVSKPIDTELLWIELDGLARTTTEAPEEAVFAEPMVMDFAKARLTMDDNRELFEDIVKQFQLDAPPHLKRIHEAQLAGDNETLRRSAHALQGMAGVLAAQGTLHWAREVEASAGSSTCATAVEHLTTALSRLDDALANYRW